MVEALRRADSHHPCPICGHPDWCGYNSQVAICMRTPSPRPAKNGGWIHRLKGQVSVPTVSVPTSRRREDEYLGAIYRELFKLLSLSAAHKANLLARGLSEEGIIRGGYRSLPLLERGRVVAELARRYDLDGVPGFYQEEGRWRLAGRPGLMIPVRRSDGLIRAVQIRLDNPLPNGDRYIWLSSSKQGGASSGVPLHVAKPQDGFKGNSLWVTEGPLKADIAAQYLGVPVVAVPGVSNWKEVPALAQELGAVVVVVAYDADKATKSAVAFHEESLVRALRRAGFIVAVASWDPARGKGLDDLLVGGGRPTVRRAA